MEEDVMPGHLAIPHSSSWFEDSKIYPDKGESDIDLSDEDKSIRLYETLVQIGVSEKMRLLCRERAIEDIVYSITYMFLCTPGFASHFGSCIEGFAIKAMEPDIDVAMILCDRVINMHTSYFCQCKRELGHNHDIDLKALDINTSFRNQFTCMVFMPAEKGFVLEPLDFELNPPVFDGDNQEPSDYRQPFNHN